MHEDIRVGDNSRTMKVHIDVEIRYCRTIEDDDLPDDWVDMDHEEKDEWVREWMAEQPIVPLDIVEDHGDITWHEG